MSIDKNKVKSTSVITDIRNFSQTFKDFQNKDSGAFLQFIENYYLALNTLARTISSRVHMSSTGDGIVAIFIDPETHHRDAFAYILSTHRLLNNLCNKFMSENEGTHLSFGMGADSGNVWKVGTGFLRTYVGTVINRAARIEQMTKMFASTTAVGNSLYKYLLKDFYPTFHQLIEETNNYDIVLNDNPEAVLISKKFALQYVFNMPLKGIQDDAPIFRVSESLINDDKLFWGIMEKLIGGKTVEIKKMF